MNKPAVVLLGLVVAVGAVSVGGAWYTGTQLEGVLQTSIQNANLELRTSMATMDGLVTVELVSLDRNLFSSTARYRVKGEGKMFADAKNAELVFVDRIEHGPLPFSRLVSLKWLPVMATSHYELEKNATTEKWFAATKDLSPLKGVANIGYDRSVDGNLELLPFDLAPDDSLSLSFSGLKVEVSASGEAKKIKGNGYMNSFKMSFVELNKPPFSIELNGLTIASDVEKSPYNFYVGKNLLELNNTKVTFGPQQSVVTVKGFEQKDTSEVTGTIMSGRLDYKADEIGYQGKPIGSLTLGAGMKNIDVPSMLSLTKLYQAKMGNMSAATGQELTLTPAEETQARADFVQLLTAKPQVTLDNVVLKTTNGESRLSLLVDLANPSSAELPPIELGKQLVSSLDLNLAVSKSLIADIAALQAQIGGVTDAQTIKQQSQMVSEMASGLAVGSQLATLDGNNILSKLHYANNEMVFNGQKMTVEQFVSFVMSKMGGIR